MYSSSPYSSTRNVLFHIAMLILICHWMHISVSYLFVSSWSLLLCSSLFTDFLTFRSSANFKWYPVHPSTHKKEELFLRPSLGYTGVLPSCWNTFSATMHWFLTFNAISFILLNPFRCPDKQNQPHVLIDSAQFFKLVRHIFMT